MKIHEYQAKQVLAGYGVPIPKGAVAHTVDEAVAVAASLGAWPLVVKAQVHAGGRGKAGGVKVVRNADELRARAADILALTIKGQRVRKVLIEPAIDIRQEIYLGIILDRARKKEVLIASAAGGVEIEEVARATPEKILYVPLQPDIGLRDYHIRRIRRFVNAPEGAAKDFAAICSGLVRAFAEKDCSLAEINPLVITGAGGAIACDAKMNFDDNAMRRHPDIEALRDEGEEEPLETLARQKRINYVKLSGKIGCIVNGAGLAMATMDIVKHYGGEPANFLDIGGGAKAEQVTEALRVITMDPSVNTIFFNIFGGIVRCDRVADGILSALKNLPGFAEKYPIVIRLIGTNDVKAREMLVGSPLIPAGGMSEGAQKAVELSRR